MIKLRCRISRFQQSLTCFLGLRSVEYRHKRKHRNRNMNMDRIAGHEPQAMGVSWREEFPCCCCRLQAIESIEPLENGRRTDVDLKGTKRARRARKLFFATKILY